MGGRRVATACLVGLTCALTLVSAVALWMRALILDTDSYVRAIGPVLDHPEVRDALSETIVDTLYSHVDVTARLQSALPKKAQEFAPTLAASIRATAVQVASAALATPAARAAWRDANRIAHDQVVRELEGKGALVTTTKGEVAIDTASLAAAVRRALDSHGIHVFDDVPASALEQQFVLFRSTQLRRAQTATHALDETATWLPLVTIAAGAGAVTCSRRRRRTIEHLAVGVAAMMVLVCIGVAVGRAYYLARVGDAYRTIAAAPFDALAQPLRVGAQAAFAVALATFVVVWLAASESVAEHEKRVREIAFEFVRTNARVLAIGGALVAAVVLVVWNRPRPGIVVGLVGVLAVWEALCLIALRAGPHPGPPAGAHGGGLDPEPPN